MTAPPLLRLLAVTEAGRRGLTGVVLWSAVLVVLILVAFAGYTLLRRWMRPTEESTADRGGFTLSELRRMHKAGELSDEEFQATRAQLIGAAKRMADQMPAVLKRPDDKPADGSDDGPRAVT